MIIVHSVYSASLQSTPATAFVLAQPVHLQLLGVGDRIFDKSLKIFGMLPATGTQVVLTLLS